MELVAPAPAKAIRGPMEPVYFGTDATWLPVRAHLERLVREQPHHGMTLEQLSRNIHSGSHRVWIWGDNDAIFMTVVFRQATGRLVCSLSWAAGADAIHPDEILPAIETYARTQGCEVMLIVGRKGWERVMRPHGFGFSDLTLMKEL